jgi:hypothetical protein
VQETIADNFSKAGWSLGWVTAVDFEGRTQLRLSINLVKKDYETVRTVGWRVHGLSTGLVENAFPG